MAVSDLNEGETMMDACDTRQTALRIEYDATCDMALALFEDLDAIEILRAHAPPARLYLLDRLQTALCLLDRIADELEDAELRRFFVEDDTEDDEESAVPT
jgi:hypothetical protein